MSLEQVVLRELSPSQKDKFCMIPLITRSPKESHVEREENAGSQGLWGGRDLGSAYVLRTEFLFVKMKKLLMVGSDGCPTI